MIVGMGGNTQSAITAGVSVAAPIGLAIAGATSAIPFVGPAIAGVTILISLFTQRGRQKTATTSIVNEVEPYMKQNLAAWGQSTKTVAEQQQALANFDGLWQQVVQACSGPGLGEPGHWCINDRSRGGKWDWFAYYRDPIANDPNVQQNSALSPLASAVGGGSNTLLLLGAGALLIYLVSQ